MINAKSTTCTRRCLYLMGIEHEKLTYRFSGRDIRLTDVYGNVLHDIIA